MRRRSVAAPLCALLVLLAPILPRAALAATSVQDLTVVPAPETAGATDATYDIGFTLTSALRGWASGAGQWITITAPAGTVFPSNSSSYVEVSGYTLVSTQVQLGTQPNSVAVSLADDFSAGASLDLRIQGVTNPGPNPADTLQVYTSTDTAPATSAPYAIITLAVQATSLPAAEVGTPYSASVDVVGGTAPYDVQTVSGALPPGLGLDGTTGAVYGTPTVPGTYPFTIQVSDSSSPVETVTARYVMGVSPAGVPACSPGSGPGGAYGAVTDASSGQAIAGADVAAYVGFPGSSPYSVAAATAGASGCYAVPASGGGTTLFVRASAAGFGAAAASAATTGGWVQQNLALAPESGPACPAATGYTAYGMVFDAATGQAIGGASIDFGSGVTATTDTHGCYQADIGALWSPYGSVLTGTAQAAGYAPATVWTTFGSSGPTPLDIALEASAPSVLVTPNPVRIDPEQSVQLTAAYSPGGGVQGEPVSAQWRSGDPSVATVSGSGQLTGVAGGQATTVSATYAGVTGTVDVTVLPPTLTGITVLPAGPSLAVGQTLAMSATAQYSDAPPAAVTGQVGWTSTQPSVAQVGADGTVTALAPGTTTIEASDGGFEGQTLLTVKAGAAGSAAVWAGNNQAAVLGQGFATNLQVRVLDANGNPLPGAAVTFTAPGGPGVPTGTFGAAGPVVTVNSDASGLATAPALVAGSTYGTFSVQASVAGLATPLAFTETDASAIVAACAQDEAAALSQAIAAGGLILVECANALVLPPVVLQDGQTVIIDGSFSPNGQPIIYAQAEQTQPSAAACGTAFQTALQGGMFYVCSGATLTLKDLTLDGSQVTLAGPDGTDGAPGAIGASGTNPQPDRGGTGSSGGGGKPGGNGDAGAAVQGGLLYIAAGATVTIEGSTLQDARVLGGAGGAGGTGGQGGAGASGGSWCDVTVAAPFYVYNCLDNGKSGGGGGGGGKAGGAGTAGSGGTAQGGAIDNAGNLTVTDTVFTGDQATGGAGGRGGAGGMGGPGGGGGNGAFGVPAQGACGTGGAGGGAGGNGASANGAGGGKGASAGAAQGGAIYNASTGVLTITGGSFDGNRATGGASGQGGYGGYGAAGAYGGNGGDGADGGGVSSDCPDGGQGGAGGDGGGGGNGGGGGGGGAAPPSAAGQGGAIYNAGTMTITGTTFGASEGNAAIGGAGPAGGPGGPGGPAGLLGSGGAGGIGSPDGAPGYPGCPGDNGSGGNGGQGGNGGAAQGGAIYTTKAVTLNDVSFGAGGADLNAVVGGLGGTGGAAGAGSNATGNACGASQQGTPSSAPPGGGPEPGSPGVNGAAAGPDVFDAASGLSLATASLPPAEVGVPYAATLDALGGIAPYVWLPSASSPLPAWAHMDAFGEVSGTPTAAGTFTFGVAISDASNPALNASGSVTIDVVQPLSLQPAALAGATVGQPYAAVLTASGGTPPYHWSVSGLPPLGLGFRSQGASAMVAGTPLEAGPADFSVQVTDSASPPDAVTAAYVIVAAPPGVGVTASSSGGSDVPGGTATAGGSGSPTPETTAYAQNGVGSVNVTYYASDPGGTATFEVAGIGYFDVNISRGSTFTNVTIVQCGMASSGDGVWWDGPQGWVFVQPQFLVGGCDYLSLGPASTPPVSALFGSIFAVGTAPSGVPAAPAAAVPPPRPAPPLFLSVGAAGGALVTPDGGFRATVPAGAIAPGGRIVLAEATVPAGAAGPPAGSGLPPLPRGTVLLSALYTLRGSGLGYPVPATLLYFPLGAGVASPQRLAVFETATGGWRALPTSVDPAAGTARVEVALPGTLAVLGDPTRFPDEPAGYWAAPALDRLIAMQVMQGFPDGTLRPDAPLTRAEFVRMLDRALNVPPASGGARFADVPARAWFAPDVAAAAAAGIIAGTAPGRFAPDAVVTRQELAVFVARALHIHGTAALKFTDAAQVAPWARPAMQAAVAAGYLAGYPDGSLRPTDPVTRAQAAEVLSRIVAQRAPAGP